MTNLGEGASLIPEEYRGHGFVGDSQVAFLNHAKEVLSRTHKKLTWDRMAKLAEIEPRTLKAYRMPENSPDHRVRCPSPFAGRSIRSWSKPVP